MTLGRQRSFDKDSVLEKAMFVFWENGYPGTTLTDLTNAMNINKPSLYSAFGNKESLFKQAVAFYLAKYGLVHMKHLKTDNLCLQQRIRNFLISIATMLTDPNLPDGCLICLCTSEIAGSCLPKSAAAEIKKINQDTVHALTDLLKEEKLNNNLVTTHDIKAIAEYLLALQFGLAVAARNGSQRDTLIGIIDFSIEIFNQE